MLYQPTIATPSLIGNSIHNAIILLSQHNLNVRILGEKEDADVPPGTVLSQTPAPGQYIKSHQSVFLLLAKQPPEQYAPLVLNQTTEVIKQLAHQQNLHIKQYTLPTIYPTDTCFAQYPCADEPLPHNEPLIAYIAQAITKPIIWPDFTGYTVEEIRSFLASHNITIEPIHRYPIAKNHTCSQCIVQNQRPYAGSLITINPTKPLQVQLQV